MVVMMKYRRQIRGKNNKHYNSFLLVHKNTLSVIWYVLKSKPTSSNFTPGVLFATFSATNFTGRQSVQLAEVKTRSRCIIWAWVWNPSDWNYSFKNYSTPFRQQYFYCSKYCTSYIIISVGCLKLFILALQTRLYRPSCFYLNHMIINYSMKTCFVL